MSSPSSALSSSCRSSSWNATRVSIQTVQRTSVGRTVGSVWVAASALVKIWELRAVARVKVVVMLVVAADTGYDGCFLPTVG
jgi:hypothetical protein